MSLPRIIVTSGEPAGIGPDLCIAIAQRSWPCELVFAGDEALFAARSRALSSPLKIARVDLDSEPRAHAAGSLPVLHVATRKPVTAGKLDVANAAYVLQLLDL